MDYLEQLDYNLKDTLIMYNVRSVCVLVESANNIHLYLKRNTIIYESN